MSPQTLNRDAEEDPMLFHVTWGFTDPSEATSKRTLALFSKWQPGPGHFQAFYGFADGRGGVALIEANSAAELAKTMAPWTPFLAFEARVILPIQEQSQITGEAAAWRDSR
jgi:hypothetical protein